MSPVASVFFLAAPMASLAAYLRLTGERKAKRPKPEAAPAQAPRKKPSELELPEPTAESESWRSAMSGMIDEEDHTLSLAEHYRRRQAAPPPAGDAD